MFGQTLWRRARTMPPRPDDARLRDGDTVPYPGYPSNTEQATAEQATAEQATVEQAGRLPAWASGPTMILPPVSAPAAQLVRPYLPT